MAIPKYDELYGPFLRAIKDGNTHDWKEIRSWVSNYLHLSESDLAEQLPSHQSVFHSRLGWAKTYLLKAGLVSSPRKSVFQITDSGKSLLESRQTINNDLLCHISPGFVEFYRTSHQSGGQPNRPNPVPNVLPAQDLTETPQEAMERAHEQIKAQLADELLEEIMNQTPTFFEKLVVDLMHGMGYGDGFVTKQSGDGGIDGIIYEDKLGFNLIYIQAKRWKTDGNISRPDIQRFAGAMMGPPKVDNGLFISTSRFSDAAKDYAKDQHIILVDGKRLCELMIEFGIGVSTIKRYDIKRIDSDYFSDT